MISFDYLVSENNVIITFDNSDENSKEIFEEIVQSLIEDGIDSDDFIYKFPVIKIPERIYISKTKTIQSVMFIYSVNPIKSEEYKSFYEIAEKRSYKKAKELPKRNADEIEDILLSKGFKRKLTDNQLNNLIKISNLSSAALFSVPGAGKTTEALAYFFLNCEEDDRLLIVGPKNVLGSWDDEIKVCLPDKDYFFTQLTGGKKRVSEILNTAPCFLSITYEQLVSAIDVVKLFVKRNKFFIFLDESHRIKNDRSKRYDAVDKLSIDAKRKLILSGTPLPQGPEDLISQFIFLYPSRIGDIDSDNVIEELKPVFTRTTKTQLGIPEINRTKCLVEMNYLQGKIYSLIRNRARKEIMALDRYQHDYLKKLGRSVLRVLMYLSNPGLLANDVDLAFNEDFGRMLLQGDGPKINVACKRVRELVSQGKKVVVWTNFIKNFGILMNRLSYLGVDYINGGVKTGKDTEIGTREWKIKRFNEDPSLRVLIANPVACGEGISLHKVCQNAIYLDRTFNVAYYIQSEDRIHRLGLPKDAKPTIEFIECKGTLDEIVDSRLSRKISIMADALDDPSLNVNISDVAYDDSDFFSGLTEDDIRAIEEYFDIKEN